MHDSAFKWMKVEIERLPLASARVLDVGSHDVNGTLRPLTAARGWQYVGLDVREGENVDVVSDDPYHFPFDDGDFDVVVSACMLHNVEQPWRLVPEMARVLRPGGALILHTIWHWGYNPHPKDYWRFMDDGMRFLLELSGTLENFQINRYDTRDIIGTAWKRQPEPKPEPSPSSVPTTTTPKSAPSPKSSKAAGGAAARRSKR